MVHCTIRLSAGRVVPYELINVGGSASYVRLT